jgi:hypothetical protein
MPTHYKAFLVVISLAAIVFWLARPAFTKFMSDEDYVRRRNLWLCLTVSAFLTPSFWIHMGIAALLIYRAAKKDSNPPALFFLLLLVVPPLEQQIPGFGLVNYLFPLHHIRLLILIIIIPEALRIRARHLNKGAEIDKNKWLAPDILLVIYGSLQVFLYVPYTSITDSVRGSFIISLDLLVPYYVLSRSCVSKQRVVEVMAAFALSAAVLAPVAIFETAKGWLVYGEMASHLNADVDIGGYLLRGDILRAQVTSGQSIVLGNFFAVGFGVWLYLQSKLEKRQAWIGSLVIGGGLIAAFARGPWLGGAVCVIVFFALGPNALPRLLKLTAVVIVCILLAMFSPYGAQIVDHLPFIGTIDAGNVSYRQAIIDRSWLIIQMNPILGSPFFSQYMGDLRTGLGIIDLLNVYLSIGMAYGLITLAAFVLFFYASVHRALRLILNNKKSDQDSTVLGAALIGALSGTLIILYTTSNYLSIPYIYTGVAALLVAYSRIKFDSLTDSSGDVREAMV